MFAKGILRYCTVGVVGNLPPNGWDMLAESTWLRGDGRGCGTGLLPISSDEVDQRILRV